MFLYIQDKLVNIGVWKVMELLLMVMHQKMVSIWNCENQLGFASGKFIIQIQIELPESHCDLISDPQMVAIWEQRRMVHLNCWMKEETMPHSGNTKLITII